jgi:hypothetical protein
LGRCGFEKTDRGPFLAPSCSVNEDPLDLSLDEKERNNTNKGVNKIDQTRASANDKHATTYKWYD